MEDEKFVGKSIMVMLTIRNDDGSIYNYKQIHGVIKQVNPDKGIAILTNDNNEFDLPYNPNSLQAAPKGEFTESSTNASVVNPGYLSIWEATLDKANNLLINWKNLGPIKFPNSNK